MKQNDTAVSSLYVHVPFCGHKCEYCAFYSAPPAGDQLNRYVGALIREMELTAPEMKPATIFFGGGTPSLLTLPQWEKILQAMQRLNLLGAVEFSVECNPATVSFDKAKLLRSYGVNRLSMGVQSLDEQLLDRLGRVHSRDMVFKSFDLMRQAGFDNINVDLMFAIPGQTMAAWQATLTEAAAMGSEHLSSYEVTYEEDTPLYEQMKAGQVEVDEDLADAMYTELLETAAHHGYRQYEVSNFARSRNPSAEIPDLACRHNVNYWRGGFFFGLGPSAASFVNDIRTKNWSNTTLYCEQLEKGRRAVESTDELPPLRRAGEIAAFGLRMNAGWPFEEFARVTGFDLRLDWAPEMEKLVGTGHAVRDAQGFRLTRLGMRFADAAAELFIR